MPNLGSPHFRWHHTHALVFDPVRGDLTHAIVGVIRAWKDILQVLMPDGLFGLIVIQDLCAGL
jgi:hypothetical protein